LMLVVGIVVCLSVCMLVVGIGVCLSAARRFVSPSDTVVYILFIQPFQLECGNSGLWALISHPAAQSVSPRVGSGWS